MYTRMFLCRWFIKTYYVLSKILIHLILLYSFMPRTMVCIPQVASLDSGAVWIFVCIYVDILQRKNVQENPKIFKSVWHIWSKLIYALTQNFDGFAWTVWINLSIIFLAHFKDMSPPVSAHHRSPESSD